MDDGLRRTPLMLAKKVVINPQAKLVILSGCFDAALGPRPLLHYVLRLFGPYRLSALGSVGSLRVFDWLRFVLLLLSYSAEDFI